MSVVEIEDPTTLYTNRVDISQQLSALYLSRDECWQTGEDQAAIQYRIDAIQQQHSHLLSSCHLCDTATIFLDAAYELPFCWRCLQERYDLWYRRICYHRSGHRK